MKREFCKECQKKEEYNGWANWETWACKLWMDNEEWTQERVREILGKFVEPDKNRYSIKEELKSLWEDMKEEIPNIDRMTDSRINWEEITDAYIEDGI